MTEHIAKPQKDIFLVLQVWRALAAILILFGHTKHEATIVAERLGQSFMNIPYANGVGVDIFFVISGFVIVYASQSLIGHQGAWKGFMKRRIIRIVPIYWFFTCAMIAALVVMPGAADMSTLNLPHIVASYLFIPYEQDAGGIFPVLGLGWSLNYEMYFYALFAVLLFLPMRSIIGVLSIFFTATSLLWFYIPQDMTLLQFWFKPIVLEFLFGAWIAYARLNGLTLPKVAFWPLIGTGFILLIALYFPPEDAIIFKRILRAIIGIVFVSAATLPAGTGHMKPPKILTDLGDSSYALYLSHPFVLTITKIIWLRISFLQHMDLWVYIAGTMVAAIICAHIFYLLCERPVLHLLKRLSKPQTAQDRVHKQT